MNRNWLLNCNGLRLNDWQRLRLDLLRRLLHGRGLNDWLLLHLDHRSRWLHWRFLNLINSYIWCLI